MHPTRNQYRVVGGYLDAWALLNLGLPGPSPPEEAMIGLGWSCFKPLTCRGRINDRLAA